MWRNLLYSIFFAVQFHIYFPAYGQANFTIINYTTENGLPQNTVKDFHFDNAGFLWIATEDGLVRYDGSVFKNLSVAAVHTLNNRITSLNYSVDNRLIVTDVNNRVEEIKDGKLHLLHPGILEQMPDLDKIYGSMLHYPLFQKLLKSNFLDRKTGNITGVLPIEKNTWALMYQKKLELYKDTTLLTSIYYPDGNNYQVFKINNDLVVFNGNTGFYKLDIRSEQWKKLKNKTGLYDLHAYKIVWDSQQTLPALIYKNSIYEIETRGENLFAKLLIDSLVNSSKITRFEYNQTWDINIIGTESEGLFIYRKTKFKQMTPSNGSKPVYGQYILSDRFILTNNGDVIGMDETKNIKSSIKSFNNYIISDSNQNNYYASGDTVYRYNISNGTTTQLFINQGSQMFVFHFYRDTLWMINSNGIFFYTNGKNYTSYLFPPNRNNLVYAIERISSSEFLYGNCLGLFSYHSVTQKIDTLWWGPQKCVRTIFRDGDKIFIGTYGDGWKVLSDGKIINMPVDRSDYLLYTHCFIKDSQGFIWITTNRGLFKFHLPEVKSYIDKKISSIGYFHYGKEEGIINTEFNGGCYPCAVQLKNGFLSLPNLAGVVWFKPENTMHSTPQTPVLFDVLEVDKKIVDIKENSVELSAGIRIFRIELGIPSFFSSDLNYQAEYRTIGIDTIWKPINKINPVIRYTTLAAGSYILEIRKPQGFGKPFYIKTLDFTVAQYWYFTPLAIFCWVLLLLLIIAVFIRLRVATLKKKQFILQQLVDEKVAEVKMINTKLLQNLQKLSGYQQELIKKEAYKTRLIRVISHDVLGPLRFMKMVAGQIEKQQSKIDKETILESLVEIKETSSDLLNLCIDLLNWINIDEDKEQLKIDYFDLNQIVQDKVELFRKIAKAKNIDLYNDCPDQFFIHNDKNIIRITLHNLLSNAIKFTEGGSIRVFAGRKDTAYYIGVKDSGLGMTNHQIEELLNGSIKSSTADTRNNEGHGIGFLIIKDLINVTQGELSIQSSRGKGTIITIQWPSNITNRVAGTVVSNKPG